MRRPITVVALATLQFLTAGALCVVRLGDGTLDGELSVGDIAGAIAIAIAGAAVVGATWSGHRAGWYAELLVALTGIVWGVVTLALDTFPGWPAFTAGIVWLVLLLLPSSRRFYLRPAAVT